MAGNTWMIPDPEDRGNSARTARFEILAEWLLTTPQDRVRFALPETQSDLAHLLGVSAAAVSQWKKSREFAKVMNRNLREHFGTERLKDVMTNMYNLAVSDTPQAVPAARVLLGFLEKTESETDLEAEVASLSDDELERLYSTMRERSSKD